MNMDLMAILLIAVGLAMDAFAVSVAHGLTSRESKSNGALKMALSFGSFQALMPVLGWTAGISVSFFISGFDHWVAFGLLSFVGGKMIYDAIAEDPSERKPKPLTAYVLLILSVATSIDALAVGLSFAFLQISIIAPIIAIGSVTFLLSFLGVTFGSRLGHLFENKIEILGGIILISIGMRILLEHSTAIVA
jgi:putative Mn2+ efflux pump MntP